MQQDIKQRRPLSHRACSLVESANNHTKERISWISEVLSAVKEMKQDDVV